MANVGVVDFVVKLIVVLLIVVGVCVMMVVVARVFFGQGQKTICQLEYSMG